VDYPEPLVNIPGKFEIFREYSTEREKDSSRMLKAGASMVLYIQVRAGFSGEAFQHCLKYIPDNSPVICENGNLAHYVDPGLKIFIHGKAGKKEPPENSGYFIIWNHDIEKIVNKIHWNSGHWKNLNSYDLF
jgi:hypothetical protein